MLRVNGIPFTTGQYETWLLIWERFLILRVIVNVTSIKFEWLCIVLHSSISLCATQLTNGPEFAQTRKSRAVLIELYLLYKFWNTGHVRDYEYEYIVTESTRRGPSIGARGGTCPPKPLGVGALGGHRRRAALWCFIRSCNAELRTSLVQLLYYCSKCTTYKMYRTHTRTFQFAQNFTQVLNKYNYAHSYSRIHIHVLPNVKIAQS